MVEQKVITYFVMFLLAVFLFSALATIVAQKALDDDLKDRVTTAGSNTILADNGTSTTLHTDTETLSVSATSKNRTWLSFDGVNDYMNIPNDNYETVSFWYKNTTTAWQNVINSSGTIYVNGSINDTNLFPIHYNGTNYLFGQTDSTTFVNVSIDEIRYYNGTINSTIAEAIYNAGR